MGLQVPTGPLHVLCLGAHPDDIEIGCGGALLTLADRPETTMAALILTASDERESETRKALGQFFPGAAVEVDHLPDGRLPAHWIEVKERLEQAAAGLPPPQLIFMPRVDDAHQDHRLIARLAGTVWRDSLFLQYEIVKWDGDLVTPNAYWSLNERQARRKVELLNDNFVSQLQRDWWDDEVFLGLMRLRGVESRTRYAEGYHTAKATIALSPGSAEKGSSGVARRT